jgi:hypothetical protein
MSRENISSMYIFAHPDPETPGRKASDASLLSTYFFQLGGIV